MSGFDNRSDLPPPNYEWSQHDFDHKVATATERSLHQSFAPVSGPNHSSNCSNEDDYEAWSDEKFQAAARAYEARQARRKMQGTTQPGASGSSSGSTLNGASPSGIQHNVSGPQTYPLGCSQTPKPADYAQPPQPYSRAPTSAPNCAPTSAPGPPISPPQPPTSPYRPVSPPGDTVSNEGGTVATTGPGLQRAVSLFRTPADARNDHGEQLPAFTDVALPEQMVPQDIAQRRLTSSQAPRTPPPPHTFSAPSGPPPSLHYRAQVGSTSPPPTVPRSPPPPHTFSSRPQSSLRNILPPPPLLNSSSPLSLSPATAPASPIHNDPPPAFTPSNSHYPAPEKTTPYARPQPGNTRVMSNSMAVYASANRTTTQPTMRFDLDAAFGRSASPGQPQENGLSFYSSAVSSSMTGRQLPKPPGGRPRTTLPPEPHSWTMGAGGQPGTYGFPNHTGTYASHHQQQPYQQPYQPGGFYTQPPGQQPCGQNQPSQQGTPWDNQYPGYGMMTPPPGGHGQPPGGWGVPPPWAGNGGQYHQ